jgi:hypothetical protein
MDEVLAALRARIAEELVEVRPCAGETDEPTWELDLLTCASSSLTFDLRGPSLAVLQVVPLAPRLHVHEVAQLLALHVSEAIRPSVDAYLAQRLARANERQQRLEVKTPANPPPQPVNDLLYAPTVILAANAGVALTAPQARPAALVELRAKKPLQPVDLIASLAVRKFADEQRDGFKASTQELAFGVGAEESIGAFGVGARVLGRASLVDVEAPSAELSGWRTLWDFGAALHASVRPWSFGAWGIGVSAAAELWWRPRRFLIHGEPVLTQSHVEVLSAIEVARSF